MKKFTYFICCIGVCLLVFFNFLMTISQRNIELAKEFEVKYSVEVSKIQIEKEKAQLELIQKSIETENEKQKAYQRMRGW